MWCRASCGQNVHWVCFEMWKGGKSGGTCPVCRSEWEVDPELVSRVVRDEATGTGSEGYVNVAEQLGINPHRGMFSFAVCLAGLLTCLDHSSYAGWGTFVPGRRRRPWYDRYD